jgi:hypothetical protein
MSRLHSSTKTQPKGFVIPSQETKVYYLMKALYGLQQPFKAWYEKIDLYFRDQGFLRNDGDHDL